MIDCQPNCGQLPLNCEYGSCDQSWDCQVATDPTDCVASLSCLPSLDEVSCGNCETVASICPFLSGNLGCGDDGRWHPTAVPPGAPAPCDVDLAGPAGPADLGAE